ncbi:hypothetical protein Q0812_01635 [Brevundimonas sp. 2R-24]|uniref:Uncharacterized protein n=1 Tax=Peiella sedimenti TaxID=3061083 RepID=A0ABT8SHT6_9CAUL|nr:hypothetical protein [Caulobacteraceae bacterium XZ-24]
MAKLTDVQAAAVRQLVKAAPDEMLHVLETAFRGGGERAAQVSAEAEAERVGREARALVFQPLMGMLHPRADGVIGAQLPRGALERLWAAAGVDPRALLDELRLMDPDAWGPVLDACAANALEALEAEEAAGELRDWLKLVPLGRSALTRLDVWLTRPSGEDAAAFRLALRDADALVEDGSRRLLEMLFSQVEESRRTLMLLTLATDRVTESFLRGSELATFVDRQLDAVEARLAGLLKLDMAAGLKSIERAAGELTWAVQLIDEVQALVELSPEGAWGKRVADARRKASGLVEERLKAAPAAVGKALPMESVTVAGTMRRKAPRLRPPADPLHTETALGLTAYGAAVRGAASLLGCSTLRNRVAEETADQADHYAEELLQMVNGGECADLGEARRMLDVCADLLHHSRGPDAAKVLRRRVAVAGPPAPSQVVA